MFLDDFKERRFTVLARSVIMERFFRTHPIKGDCRKYMPKDTIKLKPDLIARLLGIKQLQYNTHINNYRKYPGKNTRTEHMVNTYTQEMIDRLQKGKIKKIPSVVKPYVAVVLMKVSGYSEDDVIDFWRDEEGKLRLFISETVARDEFYRERLQNKYTGVVFDTRHECLNYLKLMNNDKYKKIRASESNE